MGYKMSLDISLSDRISGVEIIEMNWLRNPFGLCQFAEDNFQFYKGELEGDLDLWDVCNNWNYEKSEEIDRPEFKRVIDAYWKVLKDKEQLYYFFALPNFLQFVYGNPLPMERKFMWEEIKGKVHLEDWSKVGIPMEHFGHEAFHLNEPSTEKAKDWFAELVRFAELLQHKQYDFYCSN